MFVRTFGFFLALGQLAAGQLCSNYMDCTSCTNVNGCVWDSAPTVPICQSQSLRGEPCDGPFCVNNPTNCPSLGLYASAYTNTYPGVLASSLTSAPYIPPVSSSLYTSPSLYTAPPIYTAPSVYSAPSVYTAPAAPLYSAPVSTYSAPFYSSSFAASAPFYSNSWSTPVYGSYGGGFYGNGGFGGGYGGSFYGGGGFGGGGGGGGGNNNGLFNFNGGVTADIRNGITASALEPIIPGISGTVNTLDSVNLLQGGALNNLVSGQGYNSNPLNAYIKNQYVASQLGNVIPGITPSLNTLNNFNLLASIVR